MIEGVLALQQLSRVSVDAADGASIAPEPLLELRSERELALLSSLQTMLRELRQWEEDTDAAAAWNVISGAPGVQTRSLVLFPAADIINSDATPATTESSTAPQRVEQQPSFPVDGSPCGISESGQRCSDSPRQPRLCSPAPRLVEELDVSAALSRLLELQEAGARLRAKVSQACACVSSVLVTDLLS